MIGRQRKRRRQNVDIMDTIPEETKQEVEVELIEQHQDLDDSDQPIDIEEEQADPDDGETQGAHEETPRKGIRIPDRFLSTEKYNSKL